MAFQQSTALYDGVLHEHIMRGHPLLDAAWDRDGDAVYKALKDVGIDNAMNIRDKFGNAVTHVLAYRGAGDILKALIECLPAGSVMATNKKGRTVMHFGCEHTHYIPVLEELFKLGASPTQPDVDGNTGLHVAAEASNVEVIRMFLTHSVDFDAPNSGGVTPLTLACQLGLEELALMLTRAGADIFRRNNLFDTEHHTPFRLAQEHGFDLKAQGAVPQQPHAPVVTRMSPRETHIIWTASSGRSAAVLGYRLQVRQIDRLRPYLPWVTVEAGVKSLSHTFQTCRSNCCSFDRDAVESDLEPGEVYTVRLAAENIHGWSCPSLPSQPFVTEPAAPDKPEPPKLVETGLTHVAVKWKLPWGNGASVECSELQWKLAHTPYGKWVTVNERIAVEMINSDDEFSSAESASEEEEEQQQQKQTKDNSSVVSDSSTASSDRRGTWAQYTLWHLASAAHYKFRVRCRNMIGWSYVSSESAKFVTAAATDMSNRRSVGALKSIGAYVKCDPHAAARYNMLQRMRLDNVNKTDHLAQAQENRNFSSAREHALVRIQNWFRCLAGRWIYLRYKKEKAAQAYVLIEYDMEDQFDAGWRTKLLLSTVRARAQEQSRQLMRDEKRKRKLARQERRERHQLKRQLRRLARQKTRLSVAP